MASTRKASIAAELRADRAKFKQDLDAAKRDVKAFGDDARKAGGNFAPGAGSWAGFKQGLGSVIGKYQHLRGVVTDVAGLAIRAAGAPAQYADMSDALTAVTGSAEEAKQALDFLAGVSNEQKLEFEPLVEAYEHMRALGYSASQTRDFIREMGNAIEASGGDATDLTAVAGALAKIKDKGELSAKALAGMGETMPFLRKIMKEQFGSETAADIEKLGLTAEELFDGLMRGLKRIETSQGGALDAMSPEYIASMTRLRAGRSGMQGIGGLEKLKEGLMEGDIGKLGEGLKGGVGAITDFFIPGLDERQVDAADPEGDAARIAAFRDREAKKAREEADKKAAAGMEELERQRALLESQKYLAKAELEGNKEHIALWEDRIAIMEKAADLAKELGISEKDAAAAIVKQNELRRETAALAAEVRTPEQQADMANTKEQSEIDRLRSRGRNKEADKRQKALDLASETKRLTDQGFSPEDAAAMAEQGQQTKEDQEYFDRTGRHKMRGAKAPNRKTGIDGDFITGRADFSYFEKGMDVDFSQKEKPGRKLADAQNKLAENDKELRAAQKDPGITAEKFGELLITQRELIAAVKELQTVADKTSPKPAR